MCRRNHGAGFVTWFAIGRDQFRLEAGERELVRFDSSDHGARSFCSRCGSSLLCESARHPDQIDIVLANMHGPIDREPQVHVYFDDRVSWISVADGLPRMGGATGMEATAGIGVSHEARDPGGAGVRIIECDADLAACFPVLAQLRPHLDLDSFLARVRSQKADGYRLAALEADGQVVAVAGFRLLERLVDGRFLYVDDLVTDEEHRSHGHGAALLRWLRDYAGANSCASLQLDSGVVRKDAHRFYEREGMERSSYHFLQKVDGA
jgi:GNAT superfamily N-acetyltransferase